LEREQAPFPTPPMIGPQAGSSARESA
jgi:hypothetical protein